MSKQRKQRQPRRAMAARSTPTTQLDGAVSYLGTVVDMLLQHNIVQQRSQRALAAYVFGMLLAYGKDQSLPPPVVMGAMNLLLVSKLGYAPQAADQYTRELLNATQPGQDTQLHALIYRGIDGFARWTKGPQAVLHDFRSCLATLDAGPL